MTQEGVQTGEKSYHFAWVHEPEPTDRIWQEKPEKQGRQILHFRFYNVYNVYNIIKQPNVAISEKITHFMGTSKPEVCVFLAIPKEAESSLSVYKCSLFMFALPLSGGRKCPRLISRKCLRLMSRLTVIVTLICQMSCIRFMCSELCLQDC